MGTLYGAIVGAAPFVLAENYLNELMKFAYQGTEGIPVINELVNPDRWIMWLGILFVLSVNFFPRGIVGQLRIWAATGARKKAEAAASPMA